jgi:hypothetical protein
MRQYLQQRTTWRPLLLRILVGWVSLHHNSRPTCARRGRLLHFPIFQRSLCIDVFNTVQTTSRSAAYTPFTAKLPNIRGVAPNVVSHNFRAEDAAQPTQERELLPLSRSVQSSQPLHGLFVRSRAAIRFQPTTRLRARLVLELRKMINIQGGAALQPLFDKCLSKQDPRPEDLCSLETT